MDQKPTNPSAPNAALGAWLAIGIGIGVALGVAFNNIGLGIAIGVALGLAIGVAQASRSARAEALPPGQGRIMEERMEPIIIADNLYKSFGPVHAVRGVSFTVEPGQVFGLLGHNGAGKTTTIKMLTGRLVPDQGTAIVAGHNVIKDPDAVKPIIGTVWEEQNVYERLTAADNLEFAGQLYNVPDLARRVAEVLELVGLSDRARSKVQTYSNGMKQRLVIARALLHQPRLLFLDEPTRGLDPLFGPRGARDDRPTCGQRARRCC